jgi:hypothetical protein
MVRTKVTKCCLRVGEGLEKKMKRRGKKDLGENT